MTHGKKEDRGKRWTEDGRHGQPWWSDTPQIHGGTRERPMDKSADGWKDKRRVIAAVHASRSLLYICTV